MSFATDINTAVDTYIQMTKDAAILQLLRTGALRGINQNGSQWLAYAPNTFALGATIEEAVSNALKQESNLP